MKGELFRNFIRFGSQSLPLGKYCCQINIQVANLEYQITKKIVKIEKFLKCTVHSPS